MNQINTPSTQNFFQPNWLTPIFQNTSLALQQLPWAVWIAEPKFDKDGNRTGKWNKASKTATNIASNKPHQFRTLNLVFLVRYFYWAPQCSPSRSLLNLCHL